MVDGMVENYHGKMDVENPWRFHRKNHHFFKEKPLNDWWFSFQNNWTSTNKWWMTIVHPSNGCGISHGQPRYNFCQKHNFDPWDDPPSTEIIGAILFSNGDVLIYIYMYIYIYLHTHIYIHIIIYIYIYGENVWGIFLRLVVMDSLELPWGSAPSRFRWL